MALPYSDPADPAAVNPYFRDSDFVRGAQARANNQKIWGNCTSLDGRLVTAEGEISSIFSSYLPGLGMLFNVQISVSGNTITLSGIGGTALSASNPAYVVVPDPRTPGKLAPIILTSNITLTLPSGTPNQRIQGVNTTDGQATYAVSGSPNNGVTGAIEEFVYIMYDFLSSTPYIGLNKSPMLTQLGADYLYGCTASTIVKAGSGDTAWNAMITSKETAFSDVTKVGCVSIGPALTMTVNGGSGTGAGACGSIAIQSGYVPKWDDTKSKIRSAIDVYTGNGYGSTDNKILKFSAVNEDTGDKCQYFSHGGTLASGGVGGGEIFITRPGRYAISTFADGAASMSCGLSINSSQRTTTIRSINNINILQEGGAGQGVQPISFTKYLLAGDIIRVHTDGTSIMGPARLYCEFLGFDG